jgi:hypothetical protein
MVGEKAFFNRMPQAYPLYTALKRTVLSRQPDTTIVIQKSQIAFKNKHPFMMVWLPIRTIKDRPSIYIVVSFGLDRALTHPRIIQGIQTAPQRFMHHTLISDLAQIDETFCSWIDESAYFARHH